MNDQPRLADLLCTVSLAGDLASGRPLGHGLVRAVSVAGKGADVFDAALLWDLGSTATAFEGARSRRRAGKGEVAARLALRLGADPGAADLLAARDGQETRRKRQLVRDADTTATTEDDLGTAWVGALAADPDPDRLAVDHDGPLEAIADFADLISPFLLGHSRRVARLAEAAATAAGLEDAATLRRAGLVHDVGRVGVPAAIWNKTEALDPDEMERVRLNPGLTVIILERSVLLGPLATLASSHHECLNGTGYHRGVTGEHLPRAARLLAAVDDYAALTEARPHRPAMDQEQAERVLRHFVEGGCLDAEAVEAVLEVGGEIPQLSSPADETAFVGLATRGAPPAEIAKAFGWSRRQAKAELRELYERFGVRSRAGLALASLEEGIL